MTMLLTFIDWITLGTLPDKFTFIFLCIVLIGTITISIADDLLNKDEEKQIELYFDKDTYAGDTTSHDGPEHTNKFQIITDERTEVDKLAIR
jgi:hypothetical protein